MKILTLAFILLGVLLVIYNIAKIAVEYVPKKGKKNQKRIMQSLDVLANQFCIEEKAAAFISLINASYVRVNKLVNKGSNYSDSKQSRVFCNALDKQTVDLLKSIGGNNG